MLSIVALDSAPSLGSVCAALVGVTVVLALVLPSQVGSSQTAVLCYPRPLLMAYTGSSPQGDGLQPSLVVATERGGGEVLLAASGEGQGCCRTLYKARNSPLSPNKE